MKRGEQNYGTERTIPKNNHNDRAPETVHGDCHDVGDTLLISCLATIPRRRDGIPVVGVSDFNCHRSSAVAWEK